MASGLLHLYVLCAMCASCDASSLPHTLRLLHISSIHERAICVGNANQSCHPKPQNTSQRLTFPSLAPATTHRFPCTTSSRLFCNLCSPFCLPIVPLSSSFVVCMRWQVWDAMCGDDGVGGRGEVCFPVR